MLHGCPADRESAYSPETRTYDKHWLPWAKKQLDEAGIPTINPLMPEPWIPNYERFKAEFEKLQVDENTTLVGTSCGTAFLVRWLADTKQRVDKLILVAPWKIPDSTRAESVAFFNFEIDETIKERVNKIVYFTSDNERDVGKQSLEIYHKILGGEIINLPNHGHYLFKNMGTEEFPELIEVITAN